MRTPSLLRHRVRQAGIVAVIALLAGFVSSSRTGNLLAGGARVVSVDQVPEMDAEMCALPPPAGMNRTLYAALYQQAVAQLDDGGEREAVAARKPVRAIGDPYGKIREYIDHRLMRERQVLQCLRDGHHAIDSMAEVIYEGISPTLVRMGGLSIEAHLLKLMQEKRVVQKGRDYFLVADG